MTTSFDVFDQFSSSWLENLSAIRALKVRFHVEYEASPLAFTNTARPILFLCLPLDDKVFVPSEERICKSHVRISCSLRQTSSIVKIGRGSMQLTPELQKFVCPMIGGYTIETNG